MCKDYAYSFMWEGTTQYLNAWGASLGGVCVISVMCIASELPYGSLEARWSPGKEPIIQIFRTSWGTIC